VYRVSHSIPFVTVPLLIAFAVAGYLAGNRHASASSGPAFGKSARFASVGTTQLEYPAGWQQQTATTGVPGLPLASSLLLTPVDGASQAGLLVGELAGGGPSPLPSSFLSLLHDAPRTEVLDVPGGQIYAYSGLYISGFAKTLEVFVIPNLSGQQDTAFACYAGSTAPMLKQCEQIVASFSLIGQPQYDLSPDASYARTLGTLLHALQRERTALRARLGQRLMPAAAGVLASTLATHFQAAAKTLRDVEAPPLASVAASALAGAEAHAGDAYSSLAQAIKLESNSQYVAALDEIQRAEAGVNSALESFALLGYKLG
jgi:hypothetical protein